MYRLGQLLQQMSFLRYPLTVLLLLFARMAQMLVDYIMVKEP